MKKTVKYILSVLFWIAVWYVGAYIANKNLTISLPTPVTTLVSLKENIEKQSFWNAALLSLIRIAAGYVSAVVIGIITAVLSVKSRVFSSIITPLIQLVKAVPVASFIFIVFLWMKKALIPGFTSFLIVLPIIEANTESGIINADKKLIEAANLLGLNRKKVFRYIIMPSVLPSLSAGMITGIGLAWKSGIAAEVIARPETGLGNILWSAKNAIDYDGVFALTLCVVALSVLLEIGIKKLLGGIKNNKA